MLYLPGFCNNDRLRLLVGYLCPSGLTILVGSVLVRVVRDVRERVGDELYHIIKKDIETQVYDEGDRTRFLGYLLDEQDNLLSGNKSIRNQALDRLVAKFEDEGWTDPE